MREVTQCGDTMKTASIRELRHESTKVLRWVEEGEHVEITRRGKTVAHLTATAPETTAKRKAKDWTKAEWNAWADERREFLKKMPKLPYNIILKMREEDDRGC